MRQLTFKMPSELICDTRLSYSARCVATALYAHKSALGCTHGRDRAAWGAAALLLDKG